MSLKSLALLAASFLLILGSPESHGQTFVGTNAPGAGSSYSFSLSAGATNLSLIVSNSSTTYSHLYLKRGGVAATNSFDFSARLNGSTNTIVLEAPECAPGDYSVLVFTPVSSAQHAFTLTLSTNRTDLRTATYPVMKPIVFSTTSVLTNTGSGAWHYYQVNLPTNLAGLRLVLSSSSGPNPDIYLRRDQLPTASSYMHRGLNQTVDTITLTDGEATNSTVFIGINLQNSFVGQSTYTLSVELGYERTLVWDPGTTHDGTQVFTNASPSGGDYYFKIVTQAGTAGAWRTALKVISGEADIYLKQGAFGLYPGSYNKGSARTGSDGLVMALTAEYTVGQEWHAVVRATPGAQWTLVTGEAYVLNLGTLASAGSSDTSTNVTVGPEGLRIFKTTVSAGTYAWRLGLNGATNEVFVRKAFAPTPWNSSTYDLKQSSQMLVVPNYLVGGDTYLVSVPGTPGSSINLDCRQQTITDVSFTSSTPMTLGSYGYTTYRVEVPVQQIAWLTALATTSGSANFAVRRGSVPNEWNNDAFSEVPGLTTESVMMVPPTLSDGTFYVTVYGTGSSACTLTSGNPIVTDVPFSSTVTNDDPARTGWRVYRVLDITNQLGALGWDLVLSNQPAGTDIAIRRNAVPGKWNFRNNSTGSSSTGSYDSYSTAGYLQKAEHEADIWYVGVYNPVTPLGNFVLSMTEISSSTPDIGSGTISMTNQPPGRFAYFRMEIPAGVLGWELSLTNVTSGDPRLSVRRDRLPDSLSSHTPGGSGWSAETSTSWSSGNQWAPGDDWTGYSRDSRGSNLVGCVLSAGMGAPLEPGNYYIGVLNASGTTTPLAYQVSSKMIGTAEGVPVQSLSFPGSVSESGLKWGTPRYYSVQIPANTPSWRMKLDVTEGEAMLMVSRNIPNIGSGASSSAVTAGPGRKLQKIGDEEFLLMPASGESYLNPGTYYLSVLSEGQNPSASLDRYGSNTCSYVLSNLGPILPEALGTVSAVDIVRSGSSDPCAVKAYQFTVPSGVLAMEVRLEDKVGAPRMYLRAGTNLVSLGGGYGVTGGLASTWNDTDLIHVPNPAAGTYTLMVQSTSTTDTNQTAFTLRLRTLSSAALAFNDGIATVSDHPADAWRYYAVTVPTDAKGWDLRILNVTSGDPRMVVCRAQAPTSLSTLTPGGSGWAAGSSTSWAPGYQWAPDTDWTGYSQSPSGANESGHFLTMGMGNPLEPGIYIVGIRRGGSSTASMSYTLQSRGIGSGYAVGITDIGFIAETTIGDLAARGSAFYRVTVPSNTPSWKLQLESLVGESRFIFQKGTLPNVNGSTGMNPTTLSGGRIVTKTGSESHVYLPASGQTNIVAGDYYIAVLGEGQNPSSSRIGTNTSSAVLRSTGSITVTDAGELTVASDVVFGSTIPGGEFKAFKFHVPEGILGMQIEMTTSAGSPYFTMRVGGGVPSPSQAYGYYAGQPAQWSGNTTLSLANPQSGDYYVTVQARENAGSPVFRDAAFSFQVKATGATVLAFNNGVFTQVNQPADTPQYFYITVPPDALGWDLRLTNVTSGDPRLVVRRDKAPQSVSTITDGGSGWAASSSTTWPSGYQWAPGNDWTGQSQNSTGGNETGHLLAMGMNRPLQPGNYYVGVLKGNSTTPMSYTVVSRGIGTGYAIPVTAMAFGGSANNAALKVREAAYYSVVVPENTPSWKMRLTGTEGESLLMINKGYLPNIEAAGSSPVAGLAGRLLQKAGSEQFVLLPATGQTNIPSGIYYLAVASQGQNSSGSRSGSNTVSYTLSDLGPATPEYLGATSSGDLVRDHTLQGGEMRIYSFSVPLGSPGLQVRLENRVGNPRFSMRVGSNAPRPVDNYGYSGGEGYSWENGNLLTIANPEATNYTLTVFADDNGSLYPDASYRLVVRQTPVLDLNFSALLNTNGLMNTASGTLIDNERAFYRVIVPEPALGGKLLGWHLNIGQSTGSATVRARRDLLPSDGDIYGMPFTSGQATIVPTFLTPGTWYVEVKATGGTAYTLSSTHAVLERPAWNMQAEGQPVTTPGLTAPQFGDSGVSTNGTAPSGDGGVDLEQGQFHFYAVVVPQNNAGILRVVLEAINGNPDFYIRTNNLPTLSHDAQGRSGSVYDRALVSTGTEYANWVLLNSRYDRALQAGTNYIGIRAAGNSNARYRLRLSTGITQDLPIHGGVASAQTMAAGDFRYFRILVPSNAPSSWNVSFNEQVGNAIMHVRDTVPPGQGAGVNTYIDWANDNKNHATYSTYDTPGTHVLTTPPLRPGHVYYLGLRAVSDATIDLTTSTNGPVIGFNNILPFYGGYATNWLPAYGKAEYRITAPEEARRWKHSTTGSSSIRFYLEQGSVPTVTASDHWTGTGITTNTVAMYGASWPWLPGQMYFLVVTNTSASVQGYSFRMDGKNSSNDDEDIDGMPDSWELTFFGNTYSTGTQDADNDGNSNVLEYQDGTSPTDYSSMLARLNLATNGNGTVLVAPGSGPFSYGTPVALTATPAANHVFLNWTGPGLSTAINPLILLMTTNRHVTANFSYDYGTPGMTRADYLFENTLASSVGTPPNLTAINPGQTYTVSTVDGAARTVLRFPSGAGLQLQPTTTVFSSNNYTVVMLFRLDNVTGWRRILDTKNGGVDQGVYVREGRLRLYPFSTESAVCITNNTWHQVAVVREAGGAVRLYSDGVLRVTYADVSGYATLTAGATMRFFKDDSAEESAGYVARIRNYATALTEPEVAALDRAPSGETPKFVLTSIGADSGNYSFSITGPTGIACVIERSTNLVTWSGISNVASFPGSMVITRPASQTSELFRVRVQ